ncbi:hypothetical protein V6N12_076303 [Hibiscus sabdariffa]
MRPKTPIKHGSLSKDQVDICLHQRSSSSLPQISIGQESVQASFSPVQGSLTDRSANISCQETFSSSAAFHDQEHFVSSSQAKLSLSSVS